MRSVPEEFQSAFRYHQAGQLREAEQSYRCVLNADPCHVEALHLLGVCSHQLGRNREAEDLIRQAIQLNGSVATFQANLAAVLQAVGRHEEAALAWRKAVALQPGSADLHLGLGRALLQTGRCDEARACLEQALRMDAQLPEAWHLLGRAMIADPQRLPEVLQALDQALRLDPQATIYNDLGFVLTRAGRMAESLAAFEHALRLDPQHAGAWNNLSTTLKALGRLDEAVAACQQALQINPQLAEAACNLGVALTEQGHLNDGLAAFQRALQLKPGYAAAHSRLLFSMQYQPSISPDELLRAHREYDQRHAAAAAVININAPSPSPTNEPLRIGFVSDGFGGHPVGYFLVQLLEYLDPSEFRVFCYSDRIRSDRLTQRIRSLAPGWRETASWSKQQLGQRISDDKIDVLFDLSGHVGGQRMLLFARRIAPLQVTWIGYVGTTGLSTMDYLLADRFHIPEGEERYYSEKVLRMPHGYICYDPPHYAPNVAALPALSNGYVTFGSFNQPAKTNPQMVAVWSKVLQAVPESRLVLKYRGFADAGLQRFYQQAFGRHGIAAHRILLEGKSPHAELLAAYHRIDIALDTQPYSGGLTTCEALWMGVPVVTKPGTTFAGRHSLSHLQNAGLTGTIASTWEEYVELATTLAGDLPRLAGIRRDMRTRMAASPLCNAEQFARDWSRLISETWRCAARRMAPDKLRTPRTVSFVCGTPRHSASACRREGIPGGNEFPHFKRVSGYRLPLRSAARQIARQLATAAASAGSGTDMA